MTSIGGNIMINDITVLPNPMDATSIYLATIEAVGYTTWGDYNTAPFTWGAVSSLTWG